MSKIPKDQRECEAYAKPIKGENAQLRECLQKINQAVMQIGGTLMQPPSPALRAILEISVAMNELPLMLAHSVFNTMEQPIVKNRVGQTVKYQFSPTMTNGKEVDLVAFIDFEYHQKDLQELWWAWSTQDCRLCRVSVGYWWKIKP